MLLNIVRCTGCPLLLKNRIICSATSIVQRSRNPGSVDLNFNEKEKGGRSRVSFSASLKSLAVNSFRKISYIADSFFTFCISSQPSLIPFSNRLTIMGLNFLIGQLVKNPPAMQETPIQFLSWADPLEKGWATHASILGLPLWFRG